MISILLLPEPLRAQLGEQARSAFPRECCGLVEGVVSGTAAQATALHAMPNLASAPDRFEIDPAAHIALLRRLRETGSGIVGCYHSHPNGSAEPSARDRESASEEGFVWLIAALDAQRREKPRIAAFVSAGSAFAPLRIASHPLDRVAARSV